MEFWRAIGDKPLRHKKNEDKDYGNRRETKKNKKYDVYLRVTNKELRKNSSWSCGIREKQQLQLKAIIATTSFYRKEPQEAMKSTSTLKYRQQ